MEQSEFLEKNVFTDLKNLNDGFDKREFQYFSEDEFEKVLEKVEHFGIGLYTIESWKDGKVYSTVSHEDHKKKATDANWYKKALKTFKKSQEGLLYCATYKVSKKLLARDLSPKLNITIEVPPSDDQDVESTAE